MNATMKARMEKPGINSVLTDWRRSWLVVLAATIGYGSGGAVFQLTNGLFIVPMRQDLGWSTTAVTIAPIVTLVWGLCSPLAGILVDRLGGRRTALIGTVGVGLSVALPAIVPTSQLTLYTIAVAIGAFSALTSTPPYTRIVATWFPSGVGLPIGITLSGSAIVAVFSMPLVSWAISTWGWRAGFLADAAIILLIGLPVILLACRERQVDISSTGTDEIRGETPGLTVPQALRTAVFWLYVCAFALGCLPLGGFLSHLLPLLRDQQFPLETTVQLGMVYAIAVMFGRIAGGFLLDRIWPFATAAMLMMLAAGGAFAAGHLTGSTSFLIAAIVVWLIGTGQGAEADFIAFFSLRSFGMRSFGTVVGLMGVLATMSVAAGAFLFGRLFDLNGSYLYACYVGAVCWFVSGGLLLITGLHEAASGGSLGSEPGRQLARESDS